MPVVKKGDAKGVVKELKRLNQVKMANKAFNKNEANIGISRENQILLSKLVVDLVSKLVLSDVFMIVLDDAKDPGFLLLSALGDSTLDD